MESWNGFSWKGPQVILTPCHGQGHLLLDLSKLALNISRDGTFTSQQCFQDKQHLLAVCREMPPKHVGLS